MGILTVGMCSVVSDSWQILDYSPLGSSIHGIFQVRILEWVAISSSKGFPDPRIEPESVDVSCLVRQILDH